MSRSYITIGQLDIDFDPDIDDIDFFIEENLKKPVQRPIQYIDEYIEQRRIMPPSDPFPGFWSNSRTPYLIEPMKNMSPQSSVQHDIAMKGSQGGWTSCAENIIAYWMDESPAPILYTSATDALLKVWARSRLEPLIDSVGMRHKLIVQAEGKTRRSADKQLSKEFAGGFLDMSSAQSASSLRSRSVRILVRDEIDGSPEQLVTGEGNWIDVSFARTSAYEERKKVFDLSTPTTYERSQIYKLYLRGDQRKYLIPCPHCGKYQELVWQVDGNHGFRADTTAGLIERVYYLCEYCHDAFFNHHKSQFLKKGKWEPSSTSESKTVVSRHWSSLYSPNGMISWETLYREYLRTNEDPESMRSFTNLYLGLPYKETGQRPKIENVIELRGTYKEKEVPEGVLFLTAGIDVQQGSKKDSANPPRLEMEMLGHGIGYRTYSVSYEIFEGDVFDPFDGAWLNLYTHVSEGGLIYKRNDGMEFSPVIVFVDSGDGNVTDVVYQFCENMTGFYPIKGERWIKIKKGEKSDIPEYRSQKKYRMNADMPGNLILYTINTVWYKNHIYRNLTIPRKDTGTQRPGFCDFPIDRGKKYFRMLTAAEKKIDGTFDSGTRRDEALDCRVYAMCAADVWLQSALDNFKAKKKNDGCTAAQLQKITTRTILDYLAAKTGNLTGKN